VRYVLVAALNRARQLRRRLAAVPAERESADVGSNMSAPAVYQGPVVSKDPLHGRSVRMLSPSGAAVPAPEVVPWQKPGMLGAALPDDWLWAAAGQLGEAEQHVGPCRVCGRIAHT